MTTWISHRTTDRGSAGIASCAAFFALTIVLVGAAEMSSALSRRAAGTEHRLAESIHEANSQTLSDYPLREGGAK